MVDIPEGYVLVPREVYDLLVQSATPPEITRTPRGITFGDIPSGGTVGDPHVDKPQTI